MATATNLLTVAEFRLLPEDKGNVYHELQHGRVVTMSRQNLRTKLIQRTLRRLLEDIAPPDAYVDVEVAFRAQPEFELWVADVAYLSAARFAHTNPDDNIAGSPEIVIKVLSPSNTVEEMHDRERTCLESGTHEFWLVDPKHQQVKITTPDSRTITYQVGQQIPLPLFQNATLPVTAIFPVFHPRSS